MGSFTRDYTKYIEEECNRKKAKEKKKLKEEQKEKDEQCSTLESFLEKRSSLAKRDNFRDKLSSFLLEATFNKIFTDCMKDNIFKTKEVNSEDLAKSLLANYVEEQGSETILRNMRRGGLLLTELAKNIDDTVKSATDKVDLKDDSTSSVDKSDLDNFFQNLDMTDFSDVTNLIQTRVVQAAERFTERNYNDKIDLQDAAQKTEDTINNLKKGIRQSDEDLEEMKEAANLRVKKVKARINSRPKSLYEQMFYTLFESVLKHDYLHDTYKEDGKVNLDKIEETVSVMYTFLEMVNTLKLQMVNEEYISSVLTDLAS